MESKSPPPGCVSLYLVTCLKRECAPTRDAGVAPRRPREAVVERWTVDRGRGETGFELEGKMAL